ncbi:MAG: hypothetical protein QXE79_07560 [Candidatus Bathyarchaeia archaeon]
MRLGLWRTCISLLTDCAKPPVNIGLSHPVTIRIVELIINERSIRCTLRQVIPGLQLSSKGCGGSHLRCFRFQF